MKFIRWIAQEFIQSERRKLWNFTIESNSNSRKKSCFFLLFFCLLVWRQRLLSMTRINYKHGCADDLRKILKFQNKKKQKQLKMFSPQPRHAHTNFHAVQNWSQNICRSAAILSSWCHCTCWPISRPIRNRAFEQFCSQAPEGSPDVLASLL